MTDAPLDCSFCKIANGHIPTQLVAERDNVVAFNDIAPVAPVHVLIVPKVHIESAHRLGIHHTGIWQQMLDVAQEVADRTGVSAGGYRLVTNSGKDAGQEVSHLHLHLIGGTELGPICR